MVKGMQKFIDKFKDFPKSYTIIGGAACDILMSNADLEFRATKDIDMILVLEDNHPEFAKVFWEFIKEGGYKCGWKNNDEAHFYRFTEPNHGYPFQIELFSRNPGYVLDVPGGIIPIHIDDDTSSLSAILLNDDFYRFMLEGRETIDGVTILSAEYIIPFKMFAWLDLTKTKESGKHVNDKDLRKHKNDVFRLIQIVTPEKDINIYGSVEETIKEFIEKIETEPVALNNLGIDMEKEEALDILSKLYF